MRHSHAGTIYTNKKPYMENPVIPSHSTLSDLERSKSRSLRFWSLTSCKGAELRHMLLLNINRTAYMGSPMTLSYLTLSDIERSNSRSLRYQRLISRKGVELGYILLWNTNRKPYMESPKTTITFDLEWPWKFKVKVLDMI